MGCGVHGMPVEDGCPECFVIQTQGKNPFNGCTYCRYHGKPRMKVS
jgi:hypothetical protein